MKNVVVFDTAVGTTNLGDEIILQCLEEQMSFLLDDSFIVRFGTHVKNLPKLAYFTSNIKLQFSYNADFKLIMGTNLLSRDLMQTHIQWPIGGLESWLYDNCIMAGVGTTLSEGKITKYSRRIYKQILRPDFYHSVRDEESKRLLEDLGFKAINTGCPTMWSITPDLCKEIPIQKAERVIFSLSGYSKQQNRTQDQNFIRILRENYKEIYFWCQTTVDEAYLDTLEGTKNIPRIYSLKKYDELLNFGNIDYIGTRLHGGVYALQHKVRTIVISIDHRARGFHETNNLCICERDEISTKLADMINGEVNTDIRLRQEDIDFWKSQFSKYYPKEDRKTHENLLWVKLVGFPYKVSKKSFKFVIKIKKKIKRKRNRLNNKIKNLLKNLFFRFIYSRTMNKNTIEKGNIVFFTFQGDYTCNPKYISEEILRRNLPWNQVWVTLRPPCDVIRSFPDNVKLVQFNTKEYYDELSRAQIWIDNAFNFPKGFVNKKQGQTYVQTMHGSLGLKKIGPDAVNNKRRNAKGFLCGSLTDICISNSSFETMVYKTSFWSDSHIVELGHARNDIFFIDESCIVKIKDKVYKYFGIETDIHMALYAPTFRNDQESVEFEAIDFSKLKNALEKRFGGKWIILERVHHSSLKTADMSGLPYVLNAGYYPDIQELMMAIDMGITDYSSWIYDYVLTRKPGILYTPDLESYHDNRGFYYPIEETPFPICRSNIELVEEILCFDEELFKKSIDSFLDARGCIDDGHAAEHIVDMLMDIVDQA